MRGGRGTRRVLVVALLGGALALTAAAPASATSCRFVDGVVHARVDGGTALRMFVWPGGPEAGQIWWGNQSDSSQQGFCGRASVRNTDRVVVTGKGRTGGLDYQLPHRPFGPGRTEEATGLPEIEFVLRGGVTDFSMTGLGGSDDGEAESVHVGERGVNVNGDGDLDVRFRSRVTSVYLFLLDGADVADARGGHGTGAPWFRGRVLSVTGGDGDDVLHGHAGRDLLRGDPGTDELHGHAGSDELYDHEDDRLVGGAGDDLLMSTGGESWLLGGPGDDVLDALDSYVDVVLDGGAGDDSAWHDDEDVPVGIEHRLER